MFSGGLSALELELLDTVADLIAIDAQQGCRARLVPTAALERLHHKRPFELLEIDAMRGQLHPLADAKPRTGERKVRVGQLVALGKQHGALDGVAQLTDVTRPAVRLQPLHRIWRDAPHPLAELVVVGVHECCAGCHIDGMNRANNDIRDWLDEGGARIPKGNHGAGAWVNDPVTVKRVRELYKPSSEMRTKMENDRRIFLGAMTQVKEGMMLGVDKNTYVEPIVWTTEWAQKHYKYPVARSN